MPDSDPAALPYRVKDLERRVDILEKIKNTEQLARIDERTAHMDEEFKAFRTEVRGNFVEQSERIDTIRSRSTTAIVSVLGSVLVGVVALLVGLGVN